MDRNLHDEAPLAEWLVLEAVLDLDLPGLDDAGGGEEEGAVVQLVVAAAGEADFLQGGVPFGGPDGVALERQLFHREDGAAGSGEFPLHDRDDIRVGWLDDGADDAELGAIGWVVEGVRLDHLHEAREEIEEAGLELRGDGRSIEGRHGR